jgi:hypothetical protein
VCGASPTICLRRLATSRYNHIVAESAEQNRKHIVAESAGRDKHAPLSFKLGQKVPGRDVLGSVSPTRIPAGS